MSLNAAIAPLWRDIRSDDREASAIVEVAYDLAVFDAHFPDNPLIPGVVQVLWVQTLTSACWPDLSAAAFRGQDRVKYTQPVLPGDVLRMSLTRRGERVAFELSDEPASKDGKRTRGTLRYAP